MAIQFPDYDDPFLESFSVCGWIDRPPEQSPDGSSDDECMYARYESSHGTVLVRAWAGVSTSTRRYHLHVDTALGRLFTKDPGDTATIAEISDRFSPLLGSTVTAGIEAIVASSAPRNSASVGPAGPDGSGGGAAASNSGTATISRRTPAPGPRPDVVPRPRHLVMGVRGASRSVAGLSEARSRSEARSHFAQPAGRQRPPDGEVDRVGGEPGRPIDQ